MAVLNDNASYSAVIPRAFLLMMIALPSLCTRCSQTEVVQVRLKISSEEHLLSNNIGILGSFGTALAANATALRLVTDPSRDGCQVYQQQVTGCAVLVRRGGCSFVQKAVHAQQAGAAQVLIWNTDDELFPLGCSEEDAAFSQLAPGAALGLSVLLVTNATGSRLQKASWRHGTVGGTVLAARRLIMGPALAVLLVAATGTIVLAGNWAVRDTKADATRRVSSRNHRGRQTKLDKVHISELAAASFVVTASLMLVALFLLADWVFYILTAMFCYGSLLGTHQLVVMLRPSLRRVLRTRSSNIPAVCRLAAEVAIAAVPVVVWICTREAAWSWVLQDALGMLLMICMLRTCQLPNIKVASILLPLAFCYDVFWVFLQPQITSSESVMVVVATGGNRQESPPIVLRVPHISYGSGHLDVTPSYSILGYGDVVLPGLLCVYLRLFDNFIVPRAAILAYSTWCTLGYVMGMLLTFSALILKVGSGHGQPALLYLVPCTLGVTLALAALRGEMRMMWCGQGMEASCSGDEDEDREVRTESSESELAEQGQTVIDGCCGVECENPASDVMIQSIACGCSDRVGENFHSATNNNNLDVKQRLLTNEV